MNNIQTPDFNAMTIAELEIFLGNLNSHIKVKEMTSFNLDATNITRYYEIYMEAEKIMYEKINAAAVDVVAVEVAQVETVEIIAEVTAETKVQIATRRMVREYFPVRFGANVPANAHINPAILSCFLRETEAPELPPIVHEEPGLKRDVDAQTVIGLARKAFDPAEPIAVTDLLRLFRVADGLDKTPSFFALETMADAMGIQVGAKMLKAIREELMMARMGRAARRNEEWRLAA